jgi:hypothetical protein
MRPDVLIGFLALYALGAQVVGRFLAIRMWEDWEAEQIRRFPEQTCTERVAEYRWDHHLSDDTMAALVISVLFWWAAWIPLVAGRDQ